jgi:hypothetical protein
MNIEDIDEVIGHIEVVDETDKTKVTFELFQKIYPGKNYGHMFAPFKNMKMTEEVRVGIIYGCLTEVDGKGVDYLGYLWCVNQKIRLGRGLHKARTARTLQEIRNVLNYIETYPDTLTEDMRGIIANIKDPMSTKKNTKDTAVDVCRKLAKEGKYLRCLRHLMMNFDKFTEEEKTKIRIHCFEKLNYEKEFDK